jgi:hypothetical protein
MLYWNTWSQILYSKLCVLDICRFYPGHKSLSVRWRPLFAWYLSMLQRKSPHNMCFIPFYGALHVSYPPPQDTISREELLKPTNPVAQKAALASGNQYKVSPRPTARIKPKPIHSLVNNKVTHMEHTIWACSTQKRNTKSHGSLTVYPCLQVFFCEWWLKQSYFWNCLCKFG